MSANDQEMPADPFEDHVKFVGPFEEHRVVIDGWRVPMLSWSPVGDEGSGNLVIDGRMAIFLSFDEAQKFTPFVADVIGAALGYGAHPRRDSMHPLPTAPLVWPVRMVEIGSIDRETIDPDKPDPEPSA